LNNTSFYLFWLSRLSSAPAADAADMEEQLTAAIIIIPQNAELSRAFATFLDIS